MKIRHLCLAAFASLYMLPQLGLAQSYPEAPTKITRVAVNSTGTAFMRIAVNRPYAMQPSCSTDTGWHFVFDTKTPTGQALLAVALSAKNSQADVRLVGLGACSVFSTIETADVIDLL